MRFLLTKWKQTIFRFFRGHLKCVFFIHLEQLTAGKQDKIILSQVVVLSAFHTQCCHSRVGLPTPHLHTHGLGRWFMSDAFPDANLQILFPKEGAGFKPGTSRAVATCSTTQTTAYPNPLNTRIIQFQLRWTQLLMPQIRLHLIICRCSCEQYKKLCMIMAEVPRICLSVCNYGNRHTQKVS